VRPSCVGASTTAGVRVGSKSVQTQALLVVNVQDAAEPSVVPAPELIDAARFAV
jgi:hypothetical protein